MTLFKAIRLGGKIRRKSWPEWEHYEISEKFDQYLKLLQSDIMATDWEIYKDE